MTTSSLRLSITLLPCWLCLSRVVNENPKKLKKVTLFKYTLPKVLECSLTFIHLHANWTVGNLVGI